MTRAWQHWCPGTEARALQRQLVPGGLKKWDQPVRRELGLELAFPGEDAGTSSCGRPVAPGPSELPVQGTAHSSAPAPGAAEGEGVCLALIPCWFPALERSRAGSCTLPQLPGPSLGLSAFVPLPGTWPSGARPEPKEGWPRARRVPPSKLGTGGSPAAGVEAPQKRRQSLALQQVFQNIKVVMFGAVSPEQHNAQGQEQLCMCPALVFRNQAFPQGRSCPKLGMEDGEQRSVGRAVAQTLANVTLSYFKIFFYLAAL